MCMDDLLLDLRDNMPDGENKDAMIHTTDLCKAHCSFMTTAINRTVDFTKCASQITLNAKMETVSLISAIQWAITCVLSTQTKIPINVIPLHSEICQFVITDKQWLMENILCYLSNAVKYSVGGSITISVTLEKVDSSERHKKMKPQKRLSDSFFIFGPTKSLTALEDSFGDIDMESPPPESTYEIRSTKMLCIAVEDHGIGISEEKRKPLFQPFKQTMRMAGGTGLGLYSLAKRIEVLGGKYGVSGRNDGDVGSRFWFTIPYVEDKGYEHGSLEAFGSHNSLLQNIRLNNTYARVEKLDNKPLRPDSTHKNESSSTDVSMDNDGSSSVVPSALVVEDSVVISKSTKRMLSKAGYSVDLAENGAIALEKMKEKVYTIVIMDLQMPIMDGLEATRRIRSHEDDPVYLASGKKKQLIIGVSANSTDDVRKDTISCGMDAFVPKPFSLNHLLPFQDCFIENV